jgi:uncharacterized protein
LCSSLYFYLYGMNIKINNRLKKRIAQVIVFLSAAILASDFIYKTVKDITQMTKQKCVLYLSLPKSGFMFYEYFLELFFVIVIGVFFAVWLERWFSKYQKFYPRNPITAFLYASVIPVCSCTVIPIVKSMQDKINMRTLITLLVAAPLLNPYIIVLSYSVLGWKYGTLRIVSSFILAVTTGFIIEWFFRKGKDEIDLKNIPVSKENNIACPVLQPNIFIQTYNIVQSILPYILIAGVLGIITELYLPVNFLKHYSFDNQFLSLLIIIVIGIPLYYCNGADVVFLKPLIVHSGLELGSAMAFSLTSTAICITAIVMLTKFLGGRLTFILTVSIAVLSFLIGYAINMLM